jgi:glycosyltransferase involved in cell wall biosynthesis
MKQPLRKIDPNLIDTAKQVFHTKKVALFIVTYNAEQHISSTLTRIPDWCRQLFAEVYIIDDSSSDNTVAVAIHTGEKLGFKKFSVMKTPYNQGYGGNQKIGYNYALQKNYDIVILLHGDGQYPPEFLPDLVAPFFQSTVAMVFGSRMINRVQALRGGMPLYKWFGNQVLTKIENVLLGSHLSEFHSGYRAYSVTALKNIPLQKNSNNFHFDTDIIIQIFSQNLPIQEVPIPTHYGDEVCHVNGFHYAWNCIKSVIKYRLHRIGVFYQPGFDIQINTEKHHYDLKQHPNTLHAYIRRLAWKKADIVADIGANNGQLAANIAPRVQEILAVDIQTPEKHPQVTSLEFDLNGQFDQKLGLQRFDRVLALDIIEHLDNPEEAAEKLNRVLKNSGLLFASTANIAYGIVRLSLLLGWFNYGKHGILDKTHKRLFTVNSFRRLLENSGFRVRKIIGFGPPIADQISSRGIFGFLDYISGKLARIWPSLFSFNFLIIAQKQKDFREIYNQTLDSQSKIPNIHKH